MQLTTLAMIRFLRSAAQGYLASKSPRAARNLTRTNNALGRTLAGVLALPGGDSWYTRQSAVLAGTTPCCSTSKPCHIYKHVGMEPR
jgi:hypothetical protein